MNTQNGWYDADKQMPSKEHLEKQTEFLVKGHFESNGVKGATCHKVLTLDEAAFTIGGKIHFQQPSSFRPKKWKYIEPPILKKGAWEYDEYTPAWVRNGLTKVKGVERFQTDQAIHPLDSKKPQFQLNAFHTLYRFPEYPFWVRSRNMDTESLNSVGIETISLDEFFELIHPVKETYKYFVTYWRHTYNRPEDRDRRNNLIQASKKL